MQVPNLGGPGLPPTERRQSHAFSKTLTLFFFSVVGVMSQLSPRAPIQARLLFSCWVAALITLIAKAIFGWGSRNYPRNTTSIHPSVRPNTYTNSYYGTNPFDVRNISRREIPYPFGFGAKRRELNTLSYPNHPPLSNDSRREIRSWDTT
ncbi:MAG: hypothetical protein Tsb0021_06580 [Chlamydiales bacterium]